MGAPIGNQNAAKAKVWNAAIQRAVARLGSGKVSDPNDDRSDYVKGLDKLADEFVAQSAASPIPFFKELGDRTDGKPPQALEHSGPDGEAIETKNALSIMFITPEKSGE